MGIVQSGGTGQAKSSDYYYQIPDYPESYTAHTVAARVIDGLGFRFYWASEGLTQKDLDYRPNEKGRSAGETLDHIYGLSLTIINAVKAIPNSAQDGTTVNDDDKRREALENFRKASEFLKQADVGEMENFRAIFPTANDTIEFPFWNMLNGPISDAIYHTGQMVVFRRSTGNPINPNISVFRGRLRGTN